MHRTQIYLHDALYESLKIRAHHMHISLSELIRRTLEQDVQKDPAADARAYFAHLQPLESFQAFDSEEYVRDLRGRSRLMRVRNEFHES